MDHVFLEWVEALCGEIDPPPEGKVVTIVSSAGMIDGYKTGLRRRRRSTVAKRSRRHSTDRLPELSTRAAAAVRASCLKRRRRGQSRRQGASAIPATGDSSTS